MNNPEDIKRWAKTTLEKLVHDAIVIQRPPLVKQDEVYTLICSLVDHVYFGTDTPVTDALRQSLRIRKGTTPHVGDVR